MLHYFVSSHPQAWFQRSIKLKFVKKIEPSNSLQSLVKVIVSIDPLQPGLYHRREATAPRSDCSRSKSSRLLHWISLTMRDPVRNALCASVLCACVLAASTHGNLDVKGVLDVSTACALAALFSMAAVVLPPSAVTCRVRSFSWVVVVLLASLQLPAEAGVHAVGNPYTMREILDHRRESRSSYTNSGPGLSPYSQSLRLRGGEKPFYEKVIST